MIDVYLFDGKLYIESKGSYLVMVPGSAKTDTAYSLPEGASRLISEETAQEDAYNDGYSEGYDAGLSEGEMSAEEAGYDNGYDDGYSAGYEAGQEEL